MPSLAESRGPGLRVADVGAGTGYFAIPLARAVLPGGRVIAVDLQPEMLQLLRSRIPPDLPIDLVEGEATRSTLPDASVDVVLLANVWHELEDHSEALREVGRILAPAGRIAILDWRKDVDQPLGPPLEHRFRRPMSHEPWSNARGGSPAPKPSARTTT